MHLIGPLGMLGNLRSIRPPLVEMRDLEARRKQAVDIAGNRAVLFDHPGRDPIGHAWAFARIIVERPDRRAAWSGLPAGVAGCGEERVLDRKDEMSPWCE